MISNFESSRYLEVLDFESFAFEGLAEGEGTIFFGAVVVFLDIDFLPSAVSFFFDISSYWSPRKPSADTYFFLAGISICLKSCSSGKAKTPFSFLIGFLGFKWVEVFFFLEDFFLPDFFLESFPVA